MGRDVALTRRQLIGAAGALVIAGLMTQIWHVNEAAPEKPEVVRHEMGEWVELNGAFLMDRASENTDGYAVRVSSAELLSYNEYIERYATDGSEQIDGLNDLSLVCLTIDLRNEDSAGGLGIGGMYLVPASKNEFFVADGDLLLASETKLRESGATLVTGISIRSGTEYEMRLAFHRQGGTVEVDGKKLNEAYFEAVGAGEYDLLLTNLPVRHSIRVMV